MNKTGHAIIFTFFTLCFCWAINLKAQEPSSLRWTANVVSEKDIPEEMTFVAGAYEIEGEDWRSDQKIGVCRFLARKGDWLVGQWFMSQDKCIAVVPIEDRRANQKSSSSHTLFSKLTSDNYEVLVAESEDGYLWDLAGKKLDGYQEFRLYPSEPNDEKNRVCRALNITKAVEFRGFHVGQVDSYDNAYYCFYQLSGRGYRYPSWYIENGAVREAIGLIKRLNEEIEPPRNYQVLYVKS